MLCYPHILAIHDVGSEDGTTYLALELLEGETLRQRLEREPLPPPTPPPTFTPLTSERGAVYDARFTPDGQTVVYSAAWEGNLPEVFSTRVESPVPRPFGFPPGGVLSVSRSGELALLRSRPGNVGWPKLGMLARVPFAGGVPRDVLEDVAAADWAPDGSLCVLRRVGTQMQLEWPIGTVLYRSASIPRGNSVRVSPRGDEVAFREDRARGAALQLADRSGRVRTLAVPGDEYGHAWSGGGREQWYVDNRVLYAVDLSGRRRAIHSLGGPPSFLFDVSAEGRALLGYVRADNRVRGRAPGERGARSRRHADLRRRAVARWPVPRGEGLLVRTEPPVTASRRGARPARRARPARGHGRGPLDRGRARSLPGSRPPAAARRRADRSGRSPGGPHGHGGAGRRLVVPRWRHRAGPGARAGAPRSAVREAAREAAPRPLTPEGSLVSSFASAPESYLVGSFAASPDGAWVAVHEPPRMRCYPVAGGEPRDVPGYDGRDVLLGWSSDGRSLYVRRDPDALAAPARLFRLDVRTGQQVPWMELVPPDRAGVMFVHQVRLALDGQAYAYRYARNVHNLYVVDGPSPIDASRPTWLCAFGGPVSPEAARRSR